MDFIIRKINGTRRWFGTFSNNARDREGETIAKAALEEVVSREKAAGTYPELQFFHIDYAVGQSDFYTVVEGLLTATGTFHEADPVAKALADYVEAHPESIDGSGWGCSWRFYASPGPDRVYRQVKSIVEFTFLPSSRAANQFTNFEVEVIKMALTDEQRKALEIVLAAPELVATVEQTVAARNTSKALDEAGIQRKSVDETPTPAPETKAADPNEPDADDPKQKCKACGHAAHAKACGVAGCDCGASGGKKSLETEPLTFGDLLGIKQFIEESVSKAVAAEQTTRQQATDTVIEQVNVNLKALTEAVAALHEKIDHVEAVDKALVEAHEMPRGSYEFLKSLSAAQSPATEVKPEEALAQAAPAETNTEFFAR